MGGQLWSVTLVTCRAYRTAKRPKKSPPKRAEMSNSGCAGHPPWSAWDNPDEEGSVNEKRWPRLFLTQRR